MAIFGNGRVASGVLYVLRRLPHVLMNIKELISLINSKSKIDIYNIFKGKIIITILNVEDLYRHKKGLKFDNNDFIKNRQNYESSIV